MPRWTAWNPPDLPSEHKAVFSWGNNGRLKYATVVYFGKGARYPGRRWVEEALGVKM